MYSGRKYYYLIMFKKIDKVQKVFKTLKNKIELNMQFKFKKF